MTSDFETKEQNTNIIVFPEYEKLKEEQERLRTELSMLVLERDDLQFVTCKNIETEYILALGGLEYKAYETQCLFLRFKRKMELIQAKLNRQEKVILAEIEARLDLEFKAYKQNLEQKLEEINQAIARSKAQFLTEEEAKEFKKLYRKIVKALHPDLNKNLTPAGLSLFANAVEAYEKGDLTTMKLIAQMISEPEDNPKSKDVIKVLRESIQNLETAIKNIQEDIEEIKSKYPYTMKQILADSEKLKTRKKEITDIISRYEEGISQYKERIKEILR